MQNVIRMKGVTILKIASKIISVIALVVTVTIGALFAEMLIPNLFGVDQYVVLSGSMEPAIPTGSVVLVNTHDKDVKTNDVFTYYVETADGELNVTHRAIEVTDSYIVPKGDANEESDGQIEPSRVKGKVVFHIPLLGYLVSHVTSKLKIVLIGWVVLLNVLSIIFSYLFDEKESA